MQHELNGIFVIDKPPDMSSANVVAYVKRLLGLRKAGHAGTLDPFATGVLVCCANQGTKLARFLLHGDKTYEAVLELGVTTDTQDSTGKILSVVKGPWSSASDTVQPEDARETADMERLRSVFQRFEGSIEQVPPVYSALKHKGVPLYKLARKGKPVQKPARRVFVSSIKILETALPEIRFEVACSGGTYVRTLAADIGSALGYGAHLKALRRTKSSGFAMADAMTLAEMEALVLSGTISNRMIRMADALPRMRTHVADEGLAKKIRYGQPITKKEIAPVPDPKGDTNDRASLSFTHQDMGRKEDFFKVVDVHGTLLAVLRDTDKIDKYGYCCVCQHP